MMDIKRKPENNKDISIDFVGDSITYGMTHCRTEETYVAKFVAFLGADLNLCEFWAEHYDSQADSFGYGDWLAGGIDACHPTPKASQIIAQKIYDKFFKIIGMENRI